VDLLVSTLVLKLVIYILNSLRRKKKYIDKKWKIQVLLTIPSIRAMQLIAKSVKEIPDVIRKLCQTPPSEQLETINTYFIPAASFNHPFCRTGAFEDGPFGLNSRWLIINIYKWYKIMSPRVELEVNSVGASQTTSIPPLLPSPSQHSWIFLTCLRM
jgi:hypothetical protein